MNSILIPTDFSPVADNAMRYALAFAEHYHLDITLFHVVQLSTPDVANIVYVDAMTDIAKDSERQMQEKVASLQAENPGVNFSQKTVSGLFLDSLKEICDDIKPVAVLMGITGSGSTVDKLIGSNAILAMNSLNYPLIIVPKNSTFKPIQKICFACDLLNVVSSTPLISIKAFAKLFEAEVHVLNVDYQNRHYTANTPAEMETLASMFDTVKHEFHFIESENVQDAINNFVDQDKMDMLIMLPKKHSFFASLFHKSQTKEMAYQSHIPILALHQD